MQIYCRCLLLHNTPQAPFSLDCNWPITTRSTKDSIAQSHTRQELRAPSLQPFLYFRSDRLQSKLGGISGNRRPEAWDQLRLRVLLVKVTDPSANKGFQATMWSVQQWLRMPMATKFRQQYNNFPGDLSKNRRCFAWDHLRIHMEAIWLLLIVMIVPFSRSQQYQTKNTAHCKGITGFPEIGMEHWDYSAFLRSVCAVDVALCIQ